MKRLRIIPCLLAALLLMAACGKKQDTDAARLSGEIKGLADGSILVYGMDRLFGRLDTLTVKDGKFSDTLSVDTLTGVYLLFADGTECPVYADRREHITVTGSADNLSALRVTGTPTNDELTALRGELATLGDPAAPAVLDKAAEFIRSHPASAASAYLLEQYFFRQPDPDLKRIEELADPLTGEVKDRPAMTALLDFLENRKKLNEGRSLPYFQVTGKDGKKMSRNAFKDQYLLIHFWASWHAGSRQANAELRRLYRQQRRRKDFALMGVSLDLDRQAWLDAVRRDTLEWKQGCDLKGWDSDAVQRLNLTELPFNILVNPKGRILGINLTADEVAQKIKKE
ncbi:MAG TPA: DUF4369 domain-containing protein [Candidatus Bacteroides merdigallinarum]|uniref:DUF4369 domain-containing protein n=1 Tax=Candidatus Bacteroides merdigallinarum TaxID=2838473 RepID=A0A9D2E965_9BACE|nr:DUF4369 domain-containing protein [Candidatus Bacteroides merdigallinarum]